MRKTFYGWWVTLAAFLTFGIAVGLPYYNMPFFYDYYQREFHWSKAQITFGFPLAALLTLWVGPVLVPRFSPRKLILVGTALTCAAFLGFGTMHGALWVYYALWFLYTVGYILSGPIPHQLVISHWFRRNRGKAMGILYVGVGLVGFLGSYMVKPLTEGTNFHTALIVWGGADVSGVAARDLRRSAIAPPIRDSIRMATASRPRDIKRSRSASAICCGNIHSGCC